MLCHSYMDPAESKFSPQIVTGSYIGWLETILSHLTGRHRVWELEGLRDTEALEAVYNYAAVHKVALTDLAASHIAEVCGNDPWYIASTISNRIEEKDLTTEEGVRLSHRPFEHSREMKTTDIGQIRQRVEGDRLIEVGVHVVEHVDQGCSRGKYAPASEA